MWSKERPIPSQIVKIVHNDSHKQVEDLKTTKEQRLIYTAGCGGGQPGGWVVSLVSHQEGTETVKAQKVDDSKVGAAGELLSWLDVGFRVTLLPVHGSHHDLLPLLSGSTSEMY